MPRTIKAPPIANIRKSAGNNKAHTLFTVPAKINKSAKNARAIPVIVSPFIITIAYDNLHYLYKGYFYSIFVFLIWKKEMTFVRLNWD